jgi:peptidyl-prolyl cis-trans isomerase C
MFKKIILGCALVLTAAASNAATNETATTKAKSDALFSDKVVAKGKGVEVKQSELEDSFIAYKASVAARGETFPEARREEIESDLLDRLVITEILLSKATDEDKKKAKETAEKIITQNIKQLPSEEFFIQQLKAAGMTMEDFRRRLLEQSTCEMVIDRELKATITITDAQMKKYYDENPARFEEPEKVRASHVLISTIDKTTSQPLSPDKKKEKEKEIKKIKERAEKGEDFAKLAKEFSDDPGSKEKGGEYTFARNEGMAKPFEIAAFSLKTNQISDVVETQFGYHIIKLSEKIPAKKVELAKVSADLKEGLTQQELKKQLPDYFDKLKKEAGVEFVGDKK